jgi:hypothetical protein
MYMAWLFFGNCPVTPAGDIRPSEALCGSLLKLLGMMFHRNPLLTQFKHCCVSNDIKITEDGALWVEDCEERYATSDDSVGWG